VTMLLLWVAPLQDRAPEAVKAKAHDEVPEQIVSGAMRARGPESCIYFIALKGIHGCRHAAAEFCTSMPCFIR